RRSEGPKSYRFTDRKPASGLAQYFIEDVDLNGTRKMHGPITPRSATSEAEEPPVTTEPDATLGSLGGIFTTQPGMGVAVPAAPLPTSAQLSEQWQVAAVPAVKLVVTKPGWYRVTKSQLLAAGFNPGDNGKVLSVFTDGTEVPVLVNAKNEGKFDAEDSIEFFGRGIDMPGTGSRVYYITAKRGNGLRVKSTGGRGNSGSPSASSFPFTFERIEKTVFFTAMVTNGDRENFYGPVITSWPVEQSLTVANRDSAGTAQLQIAIQTATANMEHVIQVKWNGSVIGNVRIDGIARKTQTFNIPASQLSEGNNVVTLTAMNGWDDVSVLESLRLTYRHRYRADEDALTFTATAGTKVVVGGFSTDKLKVLDVTDPMVPQLIDVDVLNESGGTKAVSFATTGVGTRTFFAFAETRVMPPAQIAWNEPSSWNAATNAANLVIITNRAFRDSAKALETARDAQGIATEVVDVQNVYDEFSYGHHGPEAIREFLKQSQKWKTAPRYVILMGDASFDPRNYLGFGSFDFVPTRLVPTEYIKSASDDWFADFNNTGIPSLAIGRIPARTPAQAKAIVDKLIARGAAAPSGSWAQYVEVIADQQNGYPFERAASRIAATIPSAYTVDRINIGSTPSPGPAIVNAFDRGSVLTNYIGHGSVEVWSSGVFSSATASSLTNGNRLPFVVAMNCLNGYFHDLFSESIAEALMNNAGGGAIGVWASSALSGTSGQLDVNLAFNRHVFGATPMTVGDAAILAKQATANGDVRRTWILFGDPTIKLK
ncbi:MAG TPA: C25 family cysteine peptidase, partial [Gemmatimonadaceae bacterium]|nr:C25 family cysteine peptidase [Gemmatimonadaceae bacterium]